MRWHWRQTLESLERELVTDDPDESPDEQVAHRMDLVYQIHEIREAREAATPKELERLDKEAERIAQHVREVVDAMPPLTENQRAGLHPSSTRRRGSNR